MMNGEGVVALRRCEIYQTGQLGQSGQSGQLGQLGQSGQSGQLGQSGQKNWHVEDLLGWNRG